MSNSPPSTLHNLELRKSTNQRPVGRKTLQLVDRKDWAVKDLPYGVYSKICTKLNIGRDFFDDFRMIAEKLSMSRDAIIMGQDRNLTDKIFPSGVRNVTLLLICILHEIKRTDVAKVLEKWVA